MRDFVSSSNVQAVERVGPADDGLTEREREELLASILRKSDPRALSDLLRTAFDYRPGEVVENFVSCVLSLARAEPFRLEYPDGVGLPIVPINYKVSQVAYRQRDAFAYEDQFAQLLELMLVRGEIQPDF